MYITYGWKCEKGYGEYAETRGDYFSHPRLWDGVTVSDCGYSNLEKNFFPSLDRLEKFKNRNLKKYTNQQLPSHLNIKNKN